MKKTRVSLFYLITYLTLTGLGLLLAPQFVLKLLFADHPYDDAFPRFAGILMIGLAIVVFTVIRYGNPILYRMTLIVRIVMWLGTLGIYLQTRETFFIAVLCVLGLGILITGSCYLLERHSAAPVAAGTR